MTPPANRGKLAPDAGIFEFFDGVPTKKTVETLYDNLDREAFLAGEPEGLPAGEGQESTLH